MKSDQKQQYLNKGALWERRLNVVKLDAIRYLIYTVNHNIKNIMLVSLGLVSSYI